MKPAVSLALAIVLVASGCGSQEDEVRDTITTYLRAVVDGDGPKACAQLSPAAQRQLTTSVFGARNCDHAVRLYARRLPERLKGRLRNPTIDRVVVRDSRADVSVKEIEQGSLERIDGEWKISAQPPKRRPPPRIIPPPRRKRPK